MNKLDIIMAGFGIDKKSTDKSKDISEEAEQKANDIKVKKAKVEEVKEDDNEDIDNDDINNVIEED